MTVVPGRLGFALWARLAPTSVVSAVITIDRRRISDPPWVTAALDGSIPGCSAGNSAARPLRLHAQPGTAPPPGPRTSPRPARTRAAGHTAAARPQLPPGDPGRSRRKG